MTQANNNQFKSRYYFILVVILCIFLALVLRMLDLSVFRSSFLRQQSKIRTVRVIDIPAHRGMIEDRNGEPLAISTPVDSIWVNPQVFIATPEQISQLSNILGISSKVIDKKTDKKSGRWFVYLQRQIPPEIGEKVKGLGIAGIFVEREYKRYYTTGEIAAHVIGFTNIDDRGQEGLELAYDNWLRGISGKKRVLKDRLGHIVADMEDIQQPQPGHDLILSIDNRIQYLAYRELKRTVEKYKAESGSAIVLDVKTGEILAMVNQPSYNPNDRHNGKASARRNRAVTDVFEPGSTMKAFSIATALETGRYKPNSTVNTSPGWITIDGNTINDEHINHGVLTLTGILQVSSDVGVAKLILSLPQRKLWELLHKIGFGEITGSGFPGEASGVLVNRRSWRPFVLATMAFGYGLSATPLQLAQAYAVIASGGIRHPVTFLKVNSDSVPGVQVMSPSVAHSMLIMLQSVLNLGGTGRRARVPGYKVAGKTGTAYIAGPHGYDKTRYLSSFIGIAPVSDPRLVVAVIIKNPHGEHFGGLVAAPAFARIMGDALRFLGVPPDDRK